MSDLLEYKGYVGSAEYSAEDRLFYGEIKFINDLVAYEATNVNDLEKEFKESVDHYLETCERLGRKPQKAFKGQFNVRVKPELHKKAALVALKRKISLNKLVETAIDHEIAS